MLLTRLTALMGFCAAAVQAQNIFTRAGTGVPGYNGDDIRAANAQLNDPHDAAVDTAGNIYIADTGNFRIRKIAPSGIISTVAGTGVRGTSTWEIGVVEALTTGPLGNVYFTDLDAQKVRKLDVSTGALAPVAGNGQSGFTGDGGPATAASLNRPAGIAVDPAGNLFISDAGNNRIRRVDAQSGVITTFAGDGSIGFTGNGGQATAASLGGPKGLAVRDGYLYVVESSNHSVRRIDLTTGVISGLVGNGQPGGELSSPVDLAFDHIGYLYVSDRGNSRIQRFGNGSATVAGITGVSGYNGDSGLATSIIFSGLNGLGWHITDGTLLILDSGNHRLRAVAFYSRHQSILLSSSANPVSRGYPVTLTVTAGATTAGPVQFFDGAALLGSVSLWNGVATLTVTFSTLGSHSITAYYGGDQTRAPAYSNVIVQEVGRAPVSITVASTPNPSVSNQPVVFTATLSSADATGRVYFASQRGEMGTATVVNGVASISYSPGSEELLVTATYYGDVNYYYNVSPAYRHISKVPTTTTLSNAPNPSTFGSVVTLTARVSGSEAPVQFFNGSILIGVAPASNGQAVLNEAFLPAGNHALRAVYTGNNTFFESTSNTVSQTVNKASTTLVLTANPADAVSGESVSLMVTVSSDRATGYVTFYDGNRPMGTINVAAGVGALSTNSLPVGNNVITAIYTGDSNLNGSSASTRVQVKRH